MDMSKDNNRRKEDGKDKKRAKRRGRVAVTVIALAVMCWGVWQFTSMASRYDGDEAVWIRIPQGATKESVADSLREALGDEYGRKVAGYWGGNPAKSRGAYLVEPGEKAINIARMLDSGRQTPVRLTFNNIRTLDQLAERLASRMDWGEEDFKEAFAREAEAQGVSEAVLLGRMMPDTYEVYWTTDPRKTIQKILKNHDSFWNEERRGKAAALGLTPDEVEVIASIAEEETAKADERGKVARLYVNRLKRGMKLQADPTVKYAVGDFSIKRVGGPMLDIDSPYNTYRYEGLPPGPIRIPDKRTLQAVIDAPEHGYIYMCARADFSGYHDFTSDYSTHQHNAAAFRKALDARGIKL
jgi:UPF0755 protein